MASDAPRWTSAHPTALFKSPLLPCSRRVGPGAGLSRAFRQAMRMRRWQRLTRSPSIMKRRSRRWKWRGRRSRRRHPVLSQPEADSGTHGARAQCSWLVHLYPAISERRSYPSHRPQRDSAEPAGSRAHPRVPSGYVQRRPAANPAGARKRRAADAFAAAAVRSLQCGARHQPLAQKLSGFTAPISPPTDAERRN